MADRGLEITTIFLYIKIKENRRNKAGGVTVFGVYRLRVTMLLFAFEYLTGTLFQFRLVNKYYNISLYFFYVGILL